MKKIYLVVLILLLSFIAVSWAAYPVTFTWVAPTLNTDGTSLTDLAGYEIHCGKSPGIYFNVVDIPDPIALSYLDNGTLVANQSEAYCAILAYDTARNKSKFSNEIRIDFLAPGVPTNFQWN